MGACVRRKRVLWPQGGGGGLQMGAHQFHHGRSSDGLLRVDNGVPCSGPDELQVAYKGEQGEGIAKNDGALGRQGALHQEHRAFVLVMPAGQVGHWRLQG